MDILPFYKKNKNFLLHILDLTSHYEDCTILRLWIIAKVFFFFLILTKLCYVLKIGYYILSKINGTLFSYLK